MFSVSAEGVDELLKKLDTFGGQIDGLKTSWPQELETWQREDMNRKYPNTAVNDAEPELAATTQIWPTSRLAAEDNKRRRLSLKTQPKRYRVKTGKPAPSNRPILRQDLQKKLYARMIELAEKALQWP
jgi:hypothetical protein